jgi:hypothetical protein
VISKPRLLEDLIREKIHLGRRGATGFYSVKCSVCNDYKERGGWKFDDGSVGFNCFNCQHAAVYEEHGGKISRKMREVLNASGISDSEISLIVNSGHVKPIEDENITLAKLKKINTFSPSCPLPPGSKTLMADNDDDLDLRARIIEYLMGRKVNSSAPLYYSIHHRYVNRVIVPFMQRERCIFWQARSIVDAKPKYENAVVSREAVIFNIDELQANKMEPLFVHEGIFDAMMFDGIAILGSKLNPAKTELLTKSRRRKIFVIDKNRNGAQLAQQALSNGWEITFSPEGTDDTNHSVVRFGKAYTAFYLMNTVAGPGTMADLLIKKNCQ